MSLNKEKILTSCPACLVGGYIFCPICLGSGVLETWDEQVKINSNIISDPKLKAIDTRIKIVLQENRFRAKFEEGLFKDLQYLCNSYQDDDVRLRINQIMKIRRSFANKKRAVAIKHLSPAEFVFKDARIVVSKENTNFFHRNHKALFRLKRGQCIEFGRYLEDFVKNLENHAQNNSSTQLNHDIENLLNNKNVESNRKLTAIRILEGNSDRAFFIYVDEMKKVCCQFIIQLQRLDAHGWHYVSV